MQPAKNKSPCGGKPAAGNGGAGGSGGSGRKKKGKCHFCGKLGHWKKDCWSYLEKQGQKGKKEQANLVREGGDEHEQGLFMAMVTPAQRLNQWHHRQFFSMKKR